MSAPQEIVPPAAPVAEGKRRGILVNDPELVAMSRIVEIVEELDDESAKARVLGWVQQKTVKLPAFFVPQLSHSRPNE